MMQATGSTDTLWHIHNIPENSWLWSCMSWCLECYDMEHTVRYKTCYFLPFNKSVTVDPSTISSLPLSPQLKKALQTYLSNSKYKWHRIYCLLFRTGACIPVLTVLKPWWVGGSQFPWHINNIIPLVWVTKEGLLNIHEQIAVVSLLNWFTVCNGCVCLTVKTLQLSNFKSALYFMFSDCAPCCAAIPHSEERVGGN